MGRDGTQCKFAEDGKQPWPAGESPVDSARGGHSPYRLPGVGSLGGENRWKGVTTSPGLRPPAPKPGLSPAQASGSKAENNSGFRTVWRWPEDKYEQRMGVSTYHIVPERLTRGVHLISVLGCKRKLQAQVSMSPIVQMRQLRWVATDVDLTPSNPR